MLEIAATAVKEVSEVASKQVLSEAGKLPGKLGKASEVKDIPDKMSRGKETRPDQASFEQKSLEQQKPIDTQGRNVIEKSSDQNIQPDVVKESAELFYPPNATVDIGGKKYRTDDNGNPHMVFGKDGYWVRLPNIEYDVNGYHYKTDSKGRIVEVSGKLSPKNREGRKPISDYVPDMKDTDQRGHLIGDQFDGSNRLDNLVAMDKDLNNSEYKKLEGQLKKAVDAGKDVDIKIELEYGDDSERPTGFYVTYSIDGEEHEQYFSNGLKQKEG